MAVKTPRADNAFIIGTALILGGVGIYLVTRKGAPPVDAVHLRGIVLDAADGSPLSGVHVQLNGYNAVTDAAGLYSIQNIVPGTYTLTFSKDGYEDLVNEAILTEPGEHARNVYLNEVNAPNTISFGVSNVPADVEVWQLGLADYNKQNARFTGYININEVFTVSGLPDTFQFPGLLILNGYQWIVVGESLRQTYYRQSYWGPGYDNYDVQFVIPTFGDFRFNFLTGSVTQV